MTAKISTGQFICLLLICRIFDLMTFVPLVSEGYSFGTQAAAAAVSTAIQAVLVIPLVIFGHRYPGMTVTAAVSQKSAAAGRIVSAVYILFFLISTLSAAVSFMRFLNSRFFRDTGYVIMLAVFVSVCVYCAYCGIEGIARSSVFVLVFFFIILVMMALSSAGNFSMMNFYGRSDGGNLVQAVTADLARNSFIAAAAFLVKNTDKSCRRGLYGLLAAKLLISQFVMLMITGILGGYALLTEYPFIEVGSYSETGLFQRNDALYLIVWTLAAVVTVSFFIRITAGLSQELFPEIKGSSLIAGAVVFGLALAALKLGAVFGEGADTVISICVVLLTGVIPGITCLLKVKGGEEDEKA